MRDPFSAWEPARFGVDRSGGPSKAPAPRPSDRPPSGVGHEEPVKDWTYDPSQPPAPGRRGKPGRTELRWSSPHAL